MIDLNFSIDTLYILPLVPVDIDEKMERIDLLLRIYFMYQTLAASTKRIFHSLSGRICSGKSFVTTAVAPTISLVFALLKSKSPACGYMYFLILL